MSKHVNELTLAKYQKLIKTFATKCGFDKGTTAQKFMLLLEETGEFAKAARKISGIKTDKNSSQANLENEAADVFWMLIDLCNNLGIKLDKAFHDKEEKNKLRSWD